MQGLDFPPTNVLPVSSAADDQPAANHADLGTIRNWSEDLGAIPPDMNLEPAALIDNLRSSDPDTANKFRDALDRFPAVGSRFAGFELVAVLGRGTFGRVYLARQGELADRFVALKVSTDLAGESQMLARLQHTNIVPIYSVHRVSPFQAVCMPFFGVATLAHLLHRFRGNTCVPATGRQLIDTLQVLSAETDIPALGSRPGSTGPEPLSVFDLPADEGGAGVHRGPARPSGALELLRAGSYTDAVCWIGARLADGLEHAHSHGILHNDMKPANVLLTDDGQPMLLDFGVSEDMRVRAVAPGASVGGTLPYMSPEHLRSLRDRVPATDARSDVYALGIIMFELLTGVTPYREPAGGLEEEVPKMLAEREGPVPRLRGANAQVSPGLEAIVRKCLEPDPARRYQTAGDLREDLDRHRTNRPLLHAAVPLRERVRKWARRNPRLSSHASIAAATLFTLALCATGLLALNARAERAEAVEAARRLDDDMKTARYLLGSRAADTAMVAEGVETCRAALARYGLPGDPNWDRRPAFRALPEADQQTVRARLADASLLLARGHAAGAPAGAGGTDERFDAAVQANRLAERLAGAVVPRAVWEQRAELLRRLGQPADAGRAADRAKVAPLATARDYYLSGTEALADGRHAAALRLLRKAADMDPADADAHTALGVCHEGLGQFTDAAGCYTTAIALRPDHFGGYFSRGQTYLRLLDPARAKADFDRAAELRGDSPEVYFSRAIAHLDLREYERGLRDLERADELGAPRLRLLCLRSRLKGQAGDAAGAAADLADAFKEESADEVGLVSRGMARLAADLQGAAADFDAALALNPRSLPAMQNKAHALSKLGKTRDALRALDAAVREYPDYVPSRAGRAVIHARLGHEKEAIADAEESLKRDPSPTTAYQIAGVYALLDTARAGARAEALRLLTAALRKGYGFEYIENDPDLDRIRATPEFKRVLDGVRALRTDLAR
jgi:serine/threonine protein kinase/Tfp pilus assembly protein PilF